MSVTRTATTRELASFLARLRYEDVSDGAVERTKELLLDWFGSALAGKNERRVRILERFAGEMGPSEGPSEVLIAEKGSAGIDDFTEEALADAGLRAFSKRVEMVLDEEVDAAYPRRWIGVVEIEIPGGKRFTSRVEVPKGEPGNTLSPEELEEKARNLAANGGGASGEEMDRIVARAWSLDEETDVRDLLPRRSA